METGMTGTKGYYTEDEVRQLYNAERTKRSSGVMAFIYSQHEGEMFHSIYASKQAMEESNKRASSFTLVGSIDLSMDFDSQIATAMPHGGMRWSE
jgi:hypothetical protein